MSFWWLRHAPPADLAVIDENGREHAYGAIAAKAEQAAERLRAVGPGKVGFLLFGNRVESLAAYLGCLQTDHVPLLLPEAPPAGQLAQLIAQYRPDWVLGPAWRSGLPSFSGTGLAIEVIPQAGPMPPPHPDLKLLLSTSGTTGSPRLVRLSGAALEANAASIAGYLALRPGERAITALPPSYSYGLSVIHSHLAAGATVVLTSRGMTEREFWRAMEEHGVNSLAGVPHVYRVLHRLRLDRMDLPALRTLTQAGGRLDDHLTRWFDELARRRGWRFFVMYGQTEAAPRMSYLPPERLAEKVGSIGRAIPGGELMLDPETHEIVYRGANVMMGYAETRDDLVRGDELGGVLRTGDLGRCDDEGYFFVTGRIKRFIKVTGNRISLDEVEQWLLRSLAVPVAVSGRDELLAVWVETENDAVLAAAAEQLKAQFGLHHSLYRVRRCDRLPLLATGKPDYSALMELP